MKLNYKDYYICFGLNIMHYRRLCGYTQEMLAEKIGVDRTSIGRLENGCVGTTLDMVFALAEALEVAPKQLFEFKD